MVLHFFSFFFGWGCFLSLFCWKVLPYLLFHWVVFWVGLLFPSLLLGGAAWPPSLAGVASGPLSFFVVLPSFSPFWWCCFLSPLLLGGVAWPPSLSGVALFPLLLRGAASLSLSPLGGSPSKRKIQKNRKTMLKTKNRNKEKQRGKQKEEIKKKKEKLKSEFLNAIPDEKVHLSGEGGGGGGRASEFFLALELGDYLHLETPGTCSRTPQA